MAALDKFLEEQILEFSPVTRDMVRYTFTHRGKRLRPALVFLSGWEDTTVAPELVRAAAIVELIHLATLVHDDILDDATIRHASPTLFAKYGSHTAVLLGDAILAHALKLMSDFNSVELCRITATATRKICDGEIWQTAERGNENLSLDAYFNIIQMKTGELFEISAYLGAVLGGHGAEKGNAAAEFGKRLGRAYQIFDDLVDFLGTEDIIGKTLGTDLTSGKYTLPLLLLLQQLEPPARQELVKKISGGAIPIKELVEIIREDGIFDASRAFFEKEVIAAKAALAPYSDDAGTQQLLKLVNFVEAQVATFFEKK